MSDTLKRVSEGPGPRTKTALIRKTPSWTPVRRGATYCSPACGSGCTHEAYLLARMRAAELVAKINTKGWRARVWENMGWHYAAEHDGLDVSIHESLDLDGKPVDYYATGSSWLVENDRVNERAAVRRRVKHGRDPNDVVRRIARTLTNQIKACQAAYESLNLGTTAKKRSAR